MTKHLDHFYPFKVWLATLIVAPILFPILEYVQEGTYIMTGIMFFVFPFVLFSSLYYSIPTFILYYIGFRLLSKTKLSFGYSKIMLTIWSTVLIFISFKVYDWELDNNFYSYLCTSFLLGILYPIKN